MVKSLIYFLLAALCEIGGAYLVWQWQRMGRSVWWVLPAIALIFLYALVQTAQAFSFGRAFAAYGAVFIATALLWGWWVDGHAPDRWDWLGSGICLLGAAIILWMPRS